MEQAESSHKLQENTEQSETNIDSVSTAPFAIGKNDKENEGHQCTESLSPAVDPSLMETGPGGTNMAGTQLCHTLLRRWHELQSETKHRVRSQLRIQLDPSTDNVVTIEISDEEDEVLQQSNTKTRVVDDAALVDTLQKDDVKRQTAYDLVIKEKKYVTLALSANELDTDGRKVQENLSEDMTTDNVLEQEADDINPSKNGDDEMSTRVLKEKNIVLEDELLASGGNNQNLVEQTISKDVMPIVDISEQQPGNKNLNKRVANENSKSSVHPDRKNNVDTLHLFEDKLEAEVRRDKSKLLHENQSEIRLFNDHFHEQEIRIKNPKKRNLKLYNADHLIIKKKRFSSKRQKIHTERELVVRYENISTSRDLVERIRNDSIQLNHSNHVPGFLNNVFDPAFQTFRKDSDVRKSISVKSYKGFVENSKKVSKNNNFNMTGNVYEDLDEGYRLFSSPKQTVIGDYLIRADDPGIGNNDNKGDAKREVGIIGDKNTLTPESNILRELQELDVSNVEAIIDLDSDEENATIKGISGDGNKNSSNRVIRTYNAFRRNTTQGNNETTNIGTYDNRENSSFVNVNNVIKTYEGYNRIRKRKSCESKHEISKQNSAVTNKNASSKGTENDATILETDSDNAKGCNKNYCSHNKKPGKRQQNESSRFDIINLLRDHNYVDFNRRSSCSGAGAEPHNAEAEIAVDATDPKQLIRPVVVTKKLTDQIRDEMALSCPSRAPTPIYERTSPPLSPAARHKSPSPLVTPRSSRSTTPDFCSPAPKSVKKRRARKMLLSEDRNERSLSKRVELPDIEKVRRHNRNMLTAQVIPIKQYQGGLINTASCDHNESPSSPPAPACPPRPECPPRPPPAAPGDGDGDGDDADGRLRRGAAARARSFITTISKKRKYILSKVRRKPVIFGAKPYRRKRRRRRPNFTSPDNVPNDDENMPTRDLIILDNEEAPTHSTDPVPYSEITISNSNDTPSVLNEGLPTHNLATHHKEQVTILSSDSVAGFKSASSNGAFSTSNEGVPTLSLPTDQKGQDTARSCNPLARLNSAQLLQSSNDAPAALIEDNSTRQPTTVQKERELTHSFDPVAGFKSVASNAAPSVLAGGILKQNFTTVQREQKTTGHSKVVTQFESSNALNECSTQNLSKSRKEQKPPRSLKRVTFNIPTQDVTATQKDRKKSSVDSLKIGVKPHRKRKQRLHLRSESPDDASSVLDESEPMRDLIILDNYHDPCSLRPASANAVPVDGGVSMRELCTTQSNQETASKRATRNESVPSTPSLIQNKLDTCKRVKLPFPTASLNERRNSVDILYASKSNPSTKKVKACEDRELQKQSSESGFKPLLFRRGSISKKALPKEDFASLHEQETTNFSNAKGNEIKCLGITKVTSSCDSMLANNGTTLISSTLQTNLESQNHSLEPVSEIASDNSDPNVAELDQLCSPEVVDAPQAVCDLVIVNVQSLAPSQELTNERNHTPALGSEPIQPRALPKITLKRAQPVYASYHYPNEMEVLISDPQEEDQEMHLPRVGDVMGDLHVIQPDDRMGLHLVVSQEEMCNDIVSISRPNF